MVGGCIVCGPSHHEEPYWKNDDAWTQTYIQYINEAEDHIKELNGGETYWAKQYCWPNHMDAKLPDQTRRRYKGVYSVPRQQDGNAARQQWHPII